MEAFVGFGSMFGFFICIILIVIALIRRKSKKKIIIAMVIFVVVFIGAGIITINKNEKLSDITAQSEPPVLSGEEQNCFEVKVSDKPDNTDAPQTSENIQDAFSAEPNIQNDLQNIDRGITVSLTARDYSLEHASAIQEILNTVGITSISIENMTGEAESGLNAVVCYPNGYTDRDRRFFFTTEDGVLFYAGFSDEDLYDSEKGGYLKNYNDVHVSDKEVTVAVYDTLRGLAEDAVKGTLNYPSSANFGMFDWGIGRSDDNYQIIGSVTAKNGIGIEEDMSFSVWFVANDKGYDVEGVAINGIRVK